MKLEGNDAWRSLEDDDAPTPAIRLRRHTPPGVCLDCRQPSLTGRRYCEKHLTAMRARSREAMRALRRRRS
jgi:hypothetical protein